MHEAVALACLAQGSLAIPRGSMSSLLGAEVLSQLVKSACFATVAGAFVGVHTALKGRMPFAAMGLDTGTEGTPRLLCM